MGWTIRDYTNSDTDGLITRIQNLEKAIETHRRNMVDHLLEVIQFGNQGGWGVAERQRGSWSEPVEVDPSSTHMKINTVLWNSLDESPGRRQF